MNLSALNQLPANGLSTTATEASPHASALSRLSSSGMSGADFASFLHNQVQALRSPERQHLAAEHGKLPHAREDDKPANTAAPAKNDNRAVRGQAGQRPSQHEAQTIPDENDGADAQTASPPTPAQNDVLADEKANAASHPDNLLNASQTLRDALNAQAKALNDKKAQWADPSGDDATNAVDLATPILPVAPDASTTNTLAAANAQLTTIALSDKLQVITASQTAPNEKSLADFALSMGLEPSQVQALFGQSSTPTTQNSHGISTQDLLALNNAPTSQAQNNLLPFNTVNSTANSELPVQLTSTPVSSADFQALAQVTPAANSDVDTDLLSKMNNVQLQVGNAVTQLAVAPPPPSTLSVLSMMDAQLRSEDIESLKRQFDDNQITPTSDSAGLTPLNAGPMPAGRTNNHPAATPGAPAFVNQPDLAQTYENLSQKLSTELAARMHEKLNAGEWKMKFALKPASLGLVDVQLEMRDGKLTAQFQSDTAFTQDLIQNGSQKLKDALADLGLNNTAVTVGQGQSQGANQSNPGGTPGQTTLPAKREENREKLTDEAGPKIATNSNQRRNKRSQFDSYA